MSGSKTRHQLIGQRFGRYRIESCLGAGGMAEVFRATDDKLDRQVAIKVVLPAFAAEEQFQVRFVHEARAVARLEHPNILPIYDFGEHGGMPFLVMPLIEGGTLADRMLGRPLPPAQVVAWVGDLASALDAAHAAGVLHRDIKPGNVLIGREERLFLADFGIAKMCDATRLTRTGTVVGTPVYMAPEVAAGRPATSDSDRYSLAVMAYEMLAGRPPFEGENVLSILHQHATSPVPPITTRVADLPPGVDEALDLALRKDPETRPGTCRAFADGLAEQWPTEVRAAYRPPRVSDQVPTLQMTGGPGATAPEQTMATAPAVAALNPPPSGDAYATVHPPTGVVRRYGAWIGAAVVGALVASTGFVALQRMGDAPAGDGEVAVHTAASPAAGVTEQASSPAEPSMPVAEPPPPSVAPPPPTAAPPPPAASVPQPALETPPATAIGQGASEAPSRPESVGPGARRSGDDTDGGPLRQPPAGMRFQSLRSFTARSTARDFRRAVDLSRRQGGRGPKAAQAAVMERYGEGGMAYLKGDDATAAEALREVLGDQRFVALWGPSPLMLLASSASERHAFAPWELALGYGDARARAAAELDELLRREPDNPRLRFARALVHRLDSEHSKVIRYAAPVFHQLEDDDAPEARGYLAQIIGDGYQGLGHGEEALQWYRRAMEAGGPFQGLMAFRAAEAARALQRTDEAFELLELGCEAKFPPACQRLEGNPRRRGSNKR
ncbi:MAG: protein kinase [bacterium]|nr:protein kinase [bacterium]